MKYRCPYCGEETFLGAQHKVPLLVIPSSESRNKAPLLESITRSPRFYAEKRAINPACYKCKNRVTRLSRIGFKTAMSNFPILIVIDTFLILLWYKYYNSGPLVLLGIPILITAIYFSYYYFFTYFDKKIVEPEKEHYFSVKLNVKTGYRMAIRKGEIYALAPRNYKNEADHTIAILENIKKHPDKTPELEFRLIKSPSNAESELSGEVRIFYSDKIFGGEMKY